MSGFNFAQAAGLGTDTIDRKVLGMPFVNIIQKGSPEFDATHRKYEEKKIDGCKVGDILFEPERAILGQPLRVIPLDQTTLYTEWKPNKGGFVGNRQLDIVHDRNYRKGVPGTPTEYKEYLGQNELVYTMYFKVLFEHDGKWKEGIIAFTATQLKFARQWGRTILNTKIPGFEGEPPIFAASYLLSTVADGNEKGGFFSWKIAQERVLDAVQDQNLLETAFDSARQTSSASLPRPAEPKALGNSAAVEPADVAY